MCYLSKPERRMSRTGEEYLSRVLKQPFSPQLPSQRCNSLDPLLVLSQSIPTFYFPLMTLALRLWHRYPSLIHSYPHGKPTFPISHNTQFPFNTPTTTSFR